MDTTKTSPGVKDTQRSFHPLQRNARVAASSPGWRHALCLLPSRGYATKHVVEGLEPRTLYRFRLKVTSPSGEYEYSPVVAVSTTREYMQPSRRVRLKMMSWRR